jgi:phage tail tape-measure protein
MSIAETSRSNGWSSVKNLLKNLLEGSMTHERSTYGLHVLTVLIVCGALAAAGCSGGSLTTREKSAAIGALGGATAGGLIGATVGHPAAGAAIGGGLGLGAGALVGDYLQGQEEGQYQQNQQQLQQNQRVIERNRQETQRLRQQEY